MYEEDELRRGYKITKISQRREEREAPGRGKELGTHILGQEVLFRWDVGPSDPVFLAPIGSSRKTSRYPIRAQPLCPLSQINCKGSAGPRFRPPLGLVRKSRPYNWRRLWGRLLEQ